MDKNTSLILALKEYNQLLSEECTELVGMASVHGWKSTRFEEGERLRNKIKELESVSDEGQKEEKYSAEDMTTAMRQSYNAGKKIERKEETDAAYENGYMKCADDMIKYLQELKDMK